MVVSDEEKAAPVLVVIIARRVQLHYLGEMMIIIFPFFFFFFSPHSSPVDYLRASSAHQSNQERVISEGGLMLKKSVRLTAATLKHLPRRRVGAPWTGLGGGVGGGAREPLDPRQPRSHVLR